MTDGRFYPTLAKVFGKKPKFTKSEMLASRPIRLHESEPAQVSQTKWHIKAPLRPTRAARFFLRVAPAATKTFELDPLGLFVWEHCDGKTPVRQLIRLLARQYHLNERAAEVATVQFLYTLAKKGLIGMEVEKS